MRVAEATRYPEVRDALAHAWSGFMQAALPECAWLAIPNIGAAAVPYFERWQLDGLILTGGDDPHDGVRAHTEAALLGMALQRDVPVFGVCRGLQQLQLHFGGSLVPCRDEAHVGRRHRVAFARSAAPLGEPGELRDVNSFHRLGIPQSMLTAPLAACALDDDGWVEAACASRHRAAGVMWHPERERTPHPNDIAMLRRFFQLPAP